jgi:tetratricopeptide (TPR) repeat protein
MNNLRLIPIGLSLKRVPMTATKSVLSSILLTGLLVGMLMLPIGLAVADDEAPRDEVKDELSFAGGLIGMNFADFADKVVEALLRKHPEAAAQAAAVKIKVLTGRGKFDEAEALVKSLPVDKMETLAMRLSLADDFYVWGKMPKAREYYESFFKQFPNGPPKEIAEFYGESAYRYAQMMVFSGDTAGAVQAYRYVFLSKPAASVERTLLTEMAELLLKLGEKSSGDARKKIFEEVKTICKKIQWGGPDVAFGKTVVILAHMELINGKPDEARKIINDYLTMLKEIDEMLKQLPDGLRYSPMAECRYMLGVMGETEIRAAVGQGDNPANRAKIIEMTKQTLGHYYTVLINYSASSWASEAGRRGDSLANWLTSHGYVVGKLSLEKLKGVVGALLKEARGLFQQQDYKSAISKYRAVLNTFPDVPGAIPALGDLARCYAEGRDILAAKAVAGYLGERYGAAQAKDMEEAGDAILAIAGEFDSMGEKALAGEMNDLFRARFVSHPRLATVVFRDAETRLRAENYGEALAYYNQIIEKYPKERLYVDALSRAAYCHTMLGSHSNAVPLLLKYMEILSPSPDQLAARLRLADSYRLLDETVPALNEYARVIKFLTEEPAKYGASPDDITKNAKSMERAVFWRAVCYSRLRKPEDQVPLFQSKAIEGLNTFLAKYPKSELGASALSGLGTLYFLQKNPMEAQKAYDKLKKDYPDSDQAKNVTFASAKSLAEIGRMDEAVKVFEGMLADAQKFNAAQFLQAAGYLYEAGQFDTAGKFYQQAAQSVEQRPVAEQRAIWEPAMLGLARSSVGAGNWAQTVKALEAVLAKYPVSGFTIEANFMLARSYAEIASKETDQAKRFKLFNKAIGAINTARKFIKDTDLRARADFETAHIELLMGNKDEAQASFVRILLLMDPSNAKVAVWFEKALQEGVPLLLEMGSYSDVVDGCEAYLKACPQGKLADKARQWRDSAKVKMITSQPSSGPVAAPGGK